jgi:AmmeMemoRadiSam system protein B
MSLPLLRKTAVAGSWYPADARALARAVDHYLDEVDLSTVGEPLAIIAPHAGLMYSGPVAAHAYKQLAGHAIDVAIIVGPSHYVDFEGVAIYPRGAFDTPFGPVPICEPCANAIAAASPLVHEHSMAHGREHSLEMQLPFLKRVLPDAEIVPLVMGQQRRATVYELGEAIAAVARGRRAVLIASTDLSHYQSAAVAARLDNKVLQQIQRFDPDGLMSLLDAFPGHACGGGPTVSVMLAAKALGAPDSRVLKYGDSGDVSGDKDAVVGYLAAAFGALA